METAINNAVISVHEGRALHTLLQSLTGLIFFFRQILGPSMLLVQQNEKDKIFRQITFM